MGSWARRGLGNGSQGGWASGGWCGGGDDGRVETATDGAAPGIGAEGVDVFVLGKVQGLHESLAKIRERGGGFGLYMALCDGGEEAGEGGAEIAGGDVAAGEMAGDILAGLIGSEGVVLFAGVEGAEISMAGFAGRAAVTAIGKGERAQGRTVVFACGRGTANFTSGRRTAVLMRGRRTANGASRHGSLQKERFGFWGSLAEARHTTKRE